MNIPVVFAPVLIPSTELTPEEVAEFLDKRSILLHGDHYIPEKLVGEKGIPEKFKSDLFRCLSHPCSQDRFVANFPEKSYNDILQNIPDFVNRVCEQILTKSKIPLATA